MNERIHHFAALVVFALALGLMASVAVAGPGAAGAESNPPRSFPHRIWAACDFEGRTPDYGCALNLARKTRLPSSNFRL